MLLPLIAVAPAVGKFVVLVCLALCIASSSFARCESKVFFSDEPPQRPRFSEISRRAATTRKVPIVTGPPSVWNRGVSSSGSRYPDKYFSAIEQSAGDRFSQAHA